MKNIPIKQEKKIVSKVVRFSSGDKRERQIPCELLSGQEEKHVKQTWG